MHTVCKDTDTAAQHTGDVFSQHRRGHKERGWVLYSQNLQKLYQGILSVKTANSWYPMAFYLITAGLHLSQGGFLMKPLGGAGVCSFPSLKTKKAFMAVPNTQKWQYSGISLSELSNSLYPSLLNSMNFQGQLEVQRCTPTLHPQWGGGMEPAAAKKHSCFVRNCSMYYWKVWLATKLVRPPLNALLAQGMGKGNRQHQVQAPDCEFHSRQCRQAGLWFSQQLLMVTPGLLLRLLSHTPVPQGHQAKAWQGRSGDTHCGLTSALPWRNTAESHKQPTGGSGVTTIPPSGCLHKSNISVHSVV